MPAGNRGWAQQRTRTHILTILPRPAGNFFPAAKYVSSDAGTPGTKSYAALQVRLGMRPLADCFACCCLPACMLPSPVQVMEAGVKSKAFLTLGWHQTLAAACRKCCQTFHFRPHRTQRHAVVPPLAGAHDDAGHGAGAAARHQRGARRGQIDCKGLDLRGLTSGDHWSGGRQ